uniref:Uncharacterized protein n=1 Tax=Plectus sambesii TaxID=2011161 RepID=A0A914XBU9_9BILA
ARPNDHSIDPTEVHDQFRKNEPHGTDREDISKALYVGYRNNCVPQGDGCLCIVGTEASTGLEVDQVHTTDAECKCLHEETGNGCPPNQPSSTNAAS